MSARSVESGSWPSRYHSVRAISAPPRRPPHWILIPLAPDFIARKIDCFMARRKLILRSSEEATPSATTLRLNIRILHFLNVYHYPVAGHSLKFFTNCLYFSTLLANYNTSRAVQL